MDEAVKFIESLVKKGERLDEVLRVDPCRGDSFFRSRFIKHVDEVAPQKRFPSFR
jgi:hypothetical protein